MMMWDAMGGECGGYGGVGEGVKGGKKLNKKI